MHSPPLDDESVKNGGCCDGCRGAIGEEDIEGVVGIFDEVSLIVLSQISGQDCGICERVTGPPSDWVTSINGDPFD